MGQIPEPCAFYMTRTRKNLCCERAQRKRRIYRLGSFQPFAAKFTNVRIGPSRDGAVTLVSPLSNSTKLNSIEQKASFRRKKAPTFDRSFYWRHVALAAVS